VTASPLVSVDKNACSGGLHAAKKRTHESSRTTRRIGVLHLPEGAPFSPSTDRLM
jgi:hypothetical protein